MSDRAPDDGATRGTTAVDDRTARLLREGLATLQPEPYRTGDPWEVVRRAVSRRRRRTRALAGVAALAVALGAGGLAVSQPWEGGRDAQVASGDPDAVVDPDRTEGPAGPPADGRARAVAVEVADRGTEERPAAGEADPGDPVARDVVVQDVLDAMAPVGAVDAEDVRLLSATSGGADPSMGTGTSSTLVTVRSDGGALLTWTLHGLPGEPRYQRTITDGAQDGRLMWRVGSSGGQDVVVVWDPEGTLGTVSVDGVDRVMPLVDSLRWFSVDAGAKVLVDGQPLETDGP